MLQWTNSMLRFTKYWLEGYQPDRSKFRCDSDSRNSFGSLQQGNITYFNLISKLFSPIQKQVGNILPALKHESKQKQPAGCFFTAGFLTWCCRWWAPNKHHCTPEKLFHQSDFQMGIYIHWAPLSINTEECVPSLYQYSWNNGRYLGNIHGGFIT